jgi:hypothetical protein
MIRIIKLILLFCFFHQVGYSQSNTPSTQFTPDIFGRISKSVNDFQLDTTAAPNDKLTKKIKELRDLRGGFNINEAIAFKIEEDRQKKEVPEAELDKLATYFHSGDGKTKLDNATIWIYRQHFTYRELKQLVKFYKTSAGKKLATDFPIIMLQSLKAAETIKNIYTEQQKKGS